MSIGSLGSPFVGMLLGGQPQSARESDPSLRTQQHAGQDSSSLHKKSLQTVLAGSGMIYFPEIPQFKC